MGTFGKSLSRELGKNTGKVISNVVFGDKWSTPHRVTVGSRVKVAEIKAEQARNEAEALRVKAELDYKIEKKKIAASTLMEISNVSFSNDVEQVYDMITNLLSYTHIQENSQEENSVTSVALSKIEDGIFKLKRLGAFEEADYFDKKIAAIKKSIEDKKVADENEKKKSEKIFFIGGVISLILMIAIALFGKKFL